MPVFSLVLIWCWGMQGTCASVSGHHFSHIKSHFNDFKQNFKIWGYLQKRHFTKVSAATEGVRYNCEGLALTPFTDSKFSWLRHGANYFRCKREKLGQFWNLLWKFKKTNLFFFIFDFLAKIFGPSRQLSMPGRFDFMKESGGWRGQGTSRHCHMDQKNILGHTPCPAPITAIHRFPHILDT